MGGAYSLEDHERYLPEPLPGDELLNGEAAKSSTLPAAESVDVDVLKISPKMKRLIVDGWHESNGYKGRSEADAAVCTAMVRAGCTDSQIRGVFERFPIGEKFHAKGRDGPRYLAVTIDSARTLVAKQPSTSEPNNAASEPDTAASWQAVDMAAVLAGDLADTEPTVLERADGARLFYPGRVNAIFGETESGKTWVALEAARQELRAGHRVGFVDFEDTPTRIAARLLALGVAADAIVSGFACVSPMEPLTERGWEDLRAACEGTSLVVIDGVTEAMSRQNLELLDNTDIQRFYDLLPRRLARLGAAVVTLDHVTKDAQSRGRYALGGQHKLAGIDGAAYVLETVLPFGRGKDGLLRLKVAKDRPGAVRGLPDGGNATIKFHADDLVEIEIMPTVSSGDAGFRPTHLMERASRVIEETGPLSKNAVEASVKGNRGAVRLALELLINGGFVEVERGERGALLHRSVKPFREDKS